MSELPMDVTVEILSRLPASTLLRFRCVSKQFRSIIDGEYFINRHLQYHHSSRQNLIFKGNKSDFYLLDIDSVDQVSKLELLLEDWRSNDEINLIGSCDGLLAFRNSRINNRIVLLNASTKKHRILPKCVLDYDFGFGRQCVDGFGRHPGSNDYKLVRILKLGCITGVSVYSSEANSWRVIDSVPPNSSYSLKGDGALVEGTLNWAGKLMQVGGREKDFILSYDMKNEIFSEMLVPDSIEEREESIFGVKVLGGCLCLVYGFSRHPVGIWVMKEYGIKDSWVRLYSFSERGPVQWLDEMSIYSNNGDQIVGFFYSNRNVIRYGFERGRYEFKIERLPYYILRVTMYVDSLVSPNVNN